MKVAHTADLHFMNKQPILADIIKCGDFALDQFRAEAPDLIVLAGDTVDFLASPEGIMIGSPAHLAAIEFVYGCGMIAPTVIVRGTPTHDGPGAVDAFAKLKTAYPIYVTERPEQVRLTRSGAFGDVGYMDETTIVVISCLPSINKGNVVAFTSSSVAETTRETQDLIRDMFQAWAVINEEARASGIPTVLVGHGTVTGSQLSTGQVMTGKDLEFTAGDLELTKVDLACLGHIHKRQAFAWPGSLGRVFYSGSITRLNFSEEEPKGFYIHEVEDGEVTSRFVETPARTMVTLRPEGLPGIECFHDVQEGENVRIVYTVSESDVGRVDEEAIKQEALAHGAASVKVEKVIVPIVRLRAEGISKARSLEEKLLKWAETTGQGITREISEKLSLLEESEVESLTADYEEAKAYSTEEVAA